MTKLSVKTQWVSPIEHSYENIKSSEMILKYIYINTAGTNTDLNKLFWKNASSKNIVQAMLNM